MQKHLFIFSPGVWEGHGTITFSMAEDVLDFKTRWTILPEEEGKIFFNQVIEVNSFTESMRNNFCISKHTPKEFAIELENNLIGKVQGIGVITPQVIAWEFRSKEQAFEGFEIYELQESGAYTIRAEFTSGDNMRTYVKGMIEKV